LDEVCFHEVAFVGVLSVKFGVSFVVSCGRWVVFYGIGKLFVCGRDGEWVGVAPGTDLVVGVCDAVSECEALGIGGGPPGWGGVFEACFVFVFDGDDDAGLGVGLGLVFGLAVHGIFLSVWVNC
jgi:hypothetical protein